MYFTVSIIFAIVGIVFFGVGLRDHKKITRGIEELDEELKKEEILECVMDRVINQLMGYERDTFIHSMIVGEFDNSCYIVFTDNDSRNLLVLRDGKVKMSRYYHEGEELYCHRIEKESVGVIKDKADELYEVCRGVKTEDKILENTMDRACY